MCGCKHHHHDGQATTPEEHKTCKAHGHKNCACEKPADLTPAASPQSMGNAPVKTAEAILVALNGSKAAGTVVFSTLPEGSGVHISGSIHGLPPNGYFGFHVHEKGDCSSPDGMSAGGHFNPTAKPHGNIVDEHSHLGDLGNIQSNAQGEAQFSIIHRQASLNDEQLSFIGRSLIIHARKDDLNTQPSGDSGDRISCGIIVLKN
jgi:Cu-Zn family superoxide dismutase